jgi:single stranded DNA-binding protein (ssb)
MASLNKVILIGRLGKDPEITSFENGGKKMSVTLATSERYRDRDGNWVEQTDWHNLVAWGNLAGEIAEKRRNYFKGDMMYVEGRLKTRQYNDQQNTTRYITEIIVDKMMQLSSNKGQQSSSQLQGFNEQLYQQPAYSPSNMGGNAVPPVQPMPSPDPFAQQNMPEDDPPF